MSEAVNERPEESEAEQYEQVASTSKFWPLQLHMT